MELFGLTRNGQTPSPARSNCETSEGGHRSHLPLRSTSPKTTKNEPLPPKSVRLPSKEPQENVDGYVWIRRFCTLLRTMNTYLLMEHWGRLVNDFKDAEREYDQDGYASEQLARAILDYSRFTRFRQWSLYVQQRGKEFEDLMDRLEKQGHSLEAAKRFLGEEELWKTTIELAGL